VHGDVIVVLHRRVLECVPLLDLDLRALWQGERARFLRQEVVEERCSHCWTPCEAYPTILGNLAKAAVAPVTRARPQILPASSS
jgi:hypothetical protein